jgi:hypothetical protein
MKQCKSNSHVRLIRVKSPLEKTLKNARSSMQSDTSTIKKVFRLLSVLSARTIESQSRRQTTTETWGSSPLPVNIWKDPHPTSRCQMPTPSAQMHDTND